jgi:hypothetical protein
MKTNYISILSLLAILSFNACNKPDVEEPEVITCILEDGFKGEYFNSSSLESNYQINEGNDKVFVASKTETSWEKRFYFITPNNSKSFTLNGNDIKNGLVKYLFICPVCNFINQYPIDGFVKGENITPEKPINETTWMVEAKIILTTDLSQPNNSKFRDTVCIKQAFYPNKINQTP